MIFNFHVYYFFPSKKKINIYNNMKELLKTRLISAGVIFGIVVLIGGIIGLNVYLTMKYGPPEYFTSGEKIINAETMKEEIKESYNSDKADSRCSVLTAYDRHLYVPKTELANMPKVDMSRYILKSAIPPQEVCPTCPEIDYSKYVLKSSLPPITKCPACICPKVNVKAGCAQDCPKVECPAPVPCEIKKCPPPTPCPIPTEKVRYDVKYIKVPTVITKIITQDENGKIISEKYEGSPQQTVAPPSNSAAEADTNYASYNDDDKADDDAKNRETEDVMRQFRGVGNLPLNSHFLGSSAIVPHNNKVAVR